MDKAPTYQDLNRARAEEASVQNQTSERNAMSKEAQAMATPNPVLAQYMNSKTAPQGLMPRETSAGDYTSIATQIANSVPDQESYSMAMIDAATKGQVPMEAVLSDESILPMYRQELVKNMSSNQGLGQLR